MSLFNLIDNWLKDVDDRKYVGAVFIDLHKAFDVVDHTVLIDKLKCYNFSVLTVDLMNSYLTNRCQFVKYNDCHWAKSNLSSLNKIVKIQKKAARTILQKSYDTPSIQLFTELKNCKYHTGVMVFKALNHLAPSYITQSASSSSIHLRSSNQYKLSFASLKTPKTKYMLSNFSKRGRDVWNFVPIEIKQTHSLKT